MSAVASPGYVVSPYLQAVLPALEPLLAGLSTGRLREGAPATFVYDALNRRTVALSLEEHARLLDLWEQAAPVQCRVGSGSVDGLGFLREAELLLPVEACSFRCRTPAS